MQFLMGLNESYNAIRGQILLMNPLPDVAKAYSSIVQEEKQRSLGATRETTENSAMVVQRAEPMALAVRHGQGSSSRSNPSNRKPLHCSYCDRDHHVRETCWKLNGYPPEHPKHASNRSNHGSTHFKRNNSHQSSANNVKERPECEVKGQHNLPILKLMCYLGLLQTLLHLHRLIIDGGATDHITSSPTLLVNRRRTLFATVAMSSGEQSITSIGNLPLNSAATLKNVLGVPSFKVDLINLFPSLVYFADLATRTTIGLGEQRDGLYYLVALASEKPKTQTPSAAATSCRSPSSQSNNACDVCALAKQRRLPFSVSSISSVRPFELIHYPVIPLSISDLSPPAHNPHHQNLFLPSNNPHYRIRFILTITASPPPEPILRRSQRPHHPPMALRDYVCNQVTSPNHLPPLSSSPQKDIEPTSYAEAASHSHWQEAMQSELAALEANHTWSSLLFLRIGLFTNLMSTMLFFMVISMKKFICLHLRFVQSKADYSLFTCRKGKSFTALLIYVDDILITGNDVNAIVALKQFLHSHFRIKDLGDLKYFLGIEVSRSKKGISISTKIYFGNFKRWWILGAKLSWIQVNCLKIHLSIGDLLDA
ncbi:hypothetical protein AAG906_003841 [Vitis piasezkii]